MAGYIYCMKNDHPRFGRYVKVGFTERSSYMRALELSAKWGCKFEVLWDLDVYEPARAEMFIHDYLNKVRVMYEFFNVGPDVVKQWADEFFDEYWREVEGKEVPPADLIELVEKDERGELLNVEETEEAEPDDDEDAHR